MPNGPTEPDDLFDRESRHREELLTAFEDEWFAGVPPDVASFVRRFLPPWLPRREATIAELIRVDQEFRIKRGESAHVEEYLGRLGFQPSREELLDLVLGEFNLRSRFQVPPAPAEFVARFPELADDLRKHLTGWREAASVGSAAQGPWTLLHVAAGPHRGVTIRLEPGRPLVVGRADSADVRLDADPHVSRFHVRLEAVGGRVRLQDLNSRNGTQLNGEPVFEGELRPGDVLRCGETEIVRVTDADATVDLFARSAAESELENADGVPGYEIAELLGRGALGPTHRAVRIASGEDVAIKRIETAGAAADVVALIRETAELREVAGSVLLLPTDVGLAGGRPYVAVPFHHSVTFDVLTAGMSPSERLPVAARIVLRLMESLAPAHDLGLAHGGIKPSNVLQERNGDAVEVRLTDFGLRRHFGRADERGSYATPVDDLAALDPLVRKLAFGLLSAEFLASRPAMPGRDEFAKALRRLLDGEPDHLA